MFFSQSLENLSLSYYKMTMWHGKKSKKNSVKLDSEDINVGAKVISV